MPGCNSLLASRTNWRIAWEMTSPAADAPVPTDRSIWRKLDALGLLSPVVVVVWMLVMARVSSGAIRLELPHFRNFYFWNALGLAGLALLLLPGKHSPDSAGVIAEVFFLAFCAMIGVLLILTSLSNHE